VEKQSNLKPWPKGVSGNPAGRKPGSRNKLGEAFVQALADDFSEHGIAAVERVRVQEPATYLKIIGNTLPREVLMTALSVNANFDLSDMEDAKGYLAAYRYARDRIGAEPPMIDLNPEAEAAWRADQDD
jgi:hypothetical protein